MPFAIESPTTAKVEDVRVLSQKNRQPDENPGIQLMLSMKLSNHHLSTFDGALKSFLYTAAAGTTPTANKRKDNMTGALDGVEPVTDLPNLSGAGTHLKVIPWHEEVTGAEMSIAFATTSLLLDDCKAHSFRIKPQEGGTVQLKYKIDAPNASESVFAKLAKFKSRDVEVTFEQHEPAQQDLDDDVPPPPPKQATRASKAAAAPKDATQTFADAHKDGTAGEKDITGSAEAWPFPGKGKAPDEAPPQSVTTEVVKSRRKKVSAEEASA